MCATARAWKPDPVPNDLDLADLGELRRRVVDPVLTEMFSPGELTSVEVGSGYPPPIVGYGTGHGEGPGVWLSVVAGDDTCQYVFQVGGGFADADDEAHQLAGRLQDWFCETTAGWAQLRGPPRLP